MIVGNFKDDLNQYLAENKSRTGASIASTAALSDAGIPSKGALENGRMYVFNYFTKDEPFYDTFPVVIGLGTGFGFNPIGINLHYLPYTIRISFIKDIIRSFSEMFDSQLRFAGNPSKQTYMKNFTYDAVKRSLGKKYNLTHAIRQYRINRMKSPRLLGYEDWYLGATNDDNFFVGGNINQAQALYYKNK